MATKYQQPDGEELRLAFTHTLKTAKNILTRNLQRDEDDFDLGKPDYM
jgi:hypothetical protein